MAGLSDMVGFTYVPLVLESDPLGERSVQRVPEDVVGPDRVGWEHRLQDGGVLQQVPAELLKQVDEPRTGEARTRVNCKNVRVPAW